MNPRLRPLAIALIVVGVVIVVPLSYLLGTIVGFVYYTGAAGRTGLVLVWSVFVLPALSFGYWGIEWIRGLERRLTADPNAQIPGAGSIVWGALAAVLLVILALAFTCAVLLGVFAT